MQKQNTLPRYIENPWSDVPARRVSAYTAFVFWEQTNCAGTEIELRSLNLLPERRPQPSNPPPPPAGSTLLLLFTPAVTQAQTLSENVTFPTLPRVLSQRSCETRSLWDRVCVRFPVYIRNACDILLSSRRVAMHVQGVILYPSDFFWGGGGILLCTVWLQH